MKQFHLPEETAPQAGFPPLEPLEVHSGMIFGRRRTPTPPTEVSPDASGVREVLEKLLIPALSRTPCLVAFSGGRDSSAILAMATLVARRHGLEDPVPITFRYAQHPRTWEREWQEQMVRHLGLGEWEVISVRSEFDALGPLACEALRRHGLYWPANAHSMVPLLQAAADGALVTGNGGDEAFASLVQVREMSVSQTFRALPLRRALVAVPVSYLPAPVRIRLQFHGGLRLRWLRAAARREVMRRFIANSIQRNRDQRHYLERLNDSRYLELSRGILTALARDAGVRLCQPFLDLRFFKAVLAVVPRDGFPSRSAGLEAFFGDLLPRGVAQRTTKARFTEVFWGRDGQDFAKRWDGTGLDHSLIDPDKLRREWSKPRPDARSKTPLQAAWLASAGRS